MIPTPTVGLVFSGPATIRQAEQLAARLLQALAEADRIEIDCSAVTEIDITFIQLILSAGLSAANAGKALLLSAPPTGALLAVLTLCGAHTGSQQLSGFRGAPRDVRNRRSRRDFPNRGA